MYFGLIGYSLVNILNKKAQTFLKEWTWPTALFMATPLPIHVGGPEALRPTLSRGLPFSLNSMGLKSKQFTCQLFNKFKTFLFQDVELKTTGWGLF